MMTLNKNSSRVEIGINPIMIEDVIVGEIFVRNVLEQEILTDIFENYHYYGGAPKTFFLEVTRFFKELTYKKSKNPNYDYKKEIMDKGSRRSDNHIEFILNSSWNDLKHLEKLRESYLKTLSPKNKFEILRKISLVKRRPPYSLFETAKDLKINNLFKVSFSWSGMVIGLDTEGMVFKLESLFKGKDGKSRRKSKEEKLLEEEKQKQQVQETIEVLSKKSLDIKSIYKELEISKKSEVQFYLYERGIEIAIKEKLEINEFSKLLIDLVQKISPPLFQEDLNRKINLFKKGLKFIEQNLRVSNSEDKKIIAELYMILGFLYHPINYEESLDWIDLADKYANPKQKKLFARVISRIFVSFCLLESQNKDFTKAIKQLKFSNEYEPGFCGTKNPTFFDEKLNSLTKADAKHRAEQIIKAKTEERDRIMSNLSHSIKNLIATVIDPLENLQREETYNSKTIENALRGTSLVRELVNAMNLSYKGTFEDFLFDAKEHSGNESLSLEQIILEALKYSVGNMFDGKYFANFMRNYFPSREIFNSGKEAWTKVSQTKNWEELSEFLNKYFFNLELDLQGAEELVIGNQKGSVMKFTILFQEMLLNAVKYSSFIPQEQRKIKILLAQNTKGITFEVQNPYKENVQTKSTGLGLEIIKNFSKLLRTEPKIQKENGVYTSSFTFKNLWEN